MWGTRLNETSNDVGLYSQTRAVARRLDGTRATTGAVSGWFRTQRQRLSTRFRDSFITSPLVQDVFAYNDYLTSPPGQLPTLSEPLRPSLPGQRGGRSPGWATDIPPHRPRLHPGHPGSAARRGAQHRSLGFPLLRPDRLVRLRLPLRARRSH